MKEKYLLPFLRFSLMLAVLFYASTAYSQTCSISSSQTQGCIDEQITFTASIQSGSAVKSYNWDFDDNTTNNGASPVHTYDQRGTFLAQLTVEFEDGTSCRALLPKAIRIFDNPNAVLDIPESIFLCGEDRSFLFRQRSTPGLDGFPIKNYTWDLGDGDFSRNRTIRHAYENDGTYRISLEIQDEAGCKDFVQTTVNVKGFPAMNPVLSINKRDSCPTIATFTNETDSNDKFIRRIVWNLGDSTIDSCDLNGSVPCNYPWPGFRHTYSGDTVYQPSMTLVNTIGCRETVKGAPIKNIEFELKPVVEPIPKCYAAGGLVTAVRFSHPVRGSVDNVTWTYGDVNADTNSAPGWQVGHIYSGLGRYTASLTIREDFCVKDTFFCGEIIIHGPKAKIQQATGVNNNYLGPRPFPTYGFPSELVDTCRISGVEYATLDTTEVEEYEYIYCNAEKLDSSQIGPIVPNCADGKAFYTYTFKPTDSVLRKRKQIDITVNTWLKGEPLPGYDSVFMLPEGGTVSGNLHDTDLYSCDYPNWVQFPNNSVKFREFHAIDDIPSTYLDTCVLPTAPFATDSFLYLWDFKNGIPGDTSTEENPNPNSRFSTERLPFHRFDTSGCYIVTLTATDTVTGCSHSDAVRIAVGTPDAGWSEKLNVDNMTYDLQQQLSRLDGLRGMKLLGPNCTNFAQRLNMTETKPTCVKQNFWVVPDSAGTRTERKCGDKTIADYGWITKDTWIGRNFEYTYTTPGWKTVGVVIQNGDCFDTAWYHNYRYYHDFDATVKVWPTYVCPGQDFNVTLQNKSQEGIRLVTVTYTLKKHFDSAGVVLAHDTLPFTTFMNDGKLDTLTSTMNNPDAGIVDGFTFSGLGDTMKMNSIEPGHVMVDIKIETRFGCVYRIEEEVLVGHYVDFTAMPEVVCRGDSVWVRAKAYKYARFIDGFRGYGIIEDEEFLRDSVNLQWDFNDDGIIDSLGATAAFAYDDLGQYDIRLFTTDNLKCKEQTLVKEDAVTILGVEAGFTIRNDSIRYCQPQFFEFEDKSRILVPDGVKDNIDRIKSWSWNWGDGRNWVTRSEVKNGIAGSSYQHNGVFKVSLVTTLRTHDFTGGAGCIDSFHSFVEIIGPTPRFRLVGDTIGCVPFTAKVKDSTITAASWEWDLGDGSSKNSNGEDTVSLIYRTPGAYCISLTVSDSVRDLNDSVLFCTDRYPFKECEFQVVVRDVKQVSALVSDTFICPDDVVDFDFSESDSTYDRWEVNFDDGQPTVETDVPELKRQFSDTGSYRIRYTGSGPFCPDTGFVQVRVADVLSNFSMDTARSDTPTFFFRNLSSGASAYEWIFEPGIERETLSQEDVRHIFSSLGQKEVCLVSINDAGCRDTFCDQYNLDKYLYIPNTFTVNGDAINDVFQILIRGESNYEALIYNRWGGLVFESTNPDWLWNGRRQNTGDECEPGTYFLVFNYTFLGEEPKRYHGTITLLR